MLLIIGYLFIHDQNTAFRDLQQTESDKLVLIRNENEIDRKRTGCNCTAFINVAN